jgi:EAL domain-containing protein (putative c-di-GMP-specific phosphodiesterase class I)
MSEVAFEIGARAAGAVAFSLEGFEGAISFQGDIARFGLSSATLEWSGFLDRLGPADQAQFIEAVQSDRLDLRIRLIGDDKVVVYARLVGRRTGSGGFEGLMLPAGIVDTGGHGRIQEEHALTSAVENAELVAWYQPIISLASGKLAGFEALARWKRPGVGVLAPDDFLAMADDLDILSRISTVVRTSAAQDLSSWRAAHPAAEQLFIAANGTVSELLSPGFVETLLETVRGACLPEGCFKLEIAETEIMRDPEQAAAAMSALKQGGIALALDDFGTGYSSLARLEMLPFQVVKIDRYFINALSADEAAGTVVQSVIQLARHFGMQVVAEGVEDQETAERLCEMGCDFAQGYRYSGALPPELAAKAVRDGMDGRFLPA